MIDLAGAPWHKSTRSGPNNNCVEVAILASGVIAVRDTKQNGTGPVLEFTEPEWIAFLDGVRRGEFDISSLLLRLPTSTLSAAPAQSGGSAAAR